MIRYIAVVLLVLGAFLGCSSKPADQATSATQSQSQSSNPAPDIAPLALDDADSALSPTAPIDPMATENWKFEEKSEVEASMMSAGSAPSEIQRKPDGLHIISSGDFGLSRLAYSGRFTTNFETHFEFREWTQEEKVAAGAKFTRRSLPPSLLIENETRTLVKQVSLKLGEENQSTLEIHLRSSGTNLELIGPDKNTQIIGRKDDSPIRIVLLFFPSSMLVMSKFEVKENLPADTALASATPNAIADPNQAMAAAFGGMGPGGMGPGGMGPGGMGPGGMGPGGMGPGGMGPGGMGPGGMGPGGMGPGGMGPGGMGPGGMGPGGMGPGGMGPGGMGSSLVMNFNLPIPTSSNSILEVGKWFVPQQNGISAESISSEIEVTERNGRYNCLKKSTPNEFWIVRELDLEDGAEYECRIQLPTMQELMQTGASRSTMLATNLFPRPDKGNAPSTLQCPTLPPPLPTAPRDVVIKVARKGARITFTIDGNATATTAIGGEPLLFGVFMRGGLRFDIEDRDPQAGNSNRAQANPLSNHDEVIFTRLGNSQQASSVTLTENGKYLIACYELQGFVAIYDVFTGEQLKDVRVHRPLSALSRGNYIFINSRDSGSIKMLSLSDKWEELDSLNVQKSSVVHMTAPTGSAFKDELLITCHELNSNQTSRNFFNLILNIKSGKFADVARREIASLNTSGNDVLIQEGLDQTSASLGIYPIADFISGVPLPNGASFDNDLIVGRYFYSHNKTKFWMSDHLIFETDPSDPVYQDAEALIVPDLSQNAFYAITEKRIEAYLLNDTAKLVGSASMRVNVADSPLARIRDYREQSTTYSLHHPVAFTHGDMLYLFLAVPETGELLQAKTKAFLKGRNKDSIAKDLQLALSDAPEDADTKPGKKETLADVIFRAEASVVRIEASGDNGKGIGSGFVVDDKGTIVTNCHVLAGATSATAYFADGRSTEIIGTTLVSPEHDVIIAKIDVTDRPAIPFAKTKPRKGDEVIALGTPYGLDFSATRGIVSAIRTADELPPDPTAQRQGTWIQIDAPLSPGNSGGPLVDSTGKVVAMSTLASNGTAQNLNFGISAEDVSKLLKSAQNSPTRSLRLSTANLPTSDSADGKTPQNRSQANGQQDVPDDAVERYLEDCRVNFAKYVRELRTEISDLNDTVKEMERGQFPLPSGTDRNILFIRAITPQKKAVWFFKNELVKLEITEYMKERHADLLKVRSKVKSNRDPESLKTLAQNYGPKLDSRKNHEIGFLGEAIVINSYNDHEVAVDIEGVPYLVWLESTTGLSAGKPILPCAVYVDGTVTIEIPQKPSRSVTRLRQVTAPQLEAVAKRVVEQTQTTSPAANSTDSVEVSEDNIRTWSDATGKYKIEAELLKTEDGKVTLKKRDGTEVTLPIEKLSDADQEYLKSLEKP